MRIDNHAADKLRELLGNLQLAIYTESDVPEPTQEKLIALISTEGFRLVDELEGVIR
jgi:hypothetical protein